MTARRLTWTEKVTLFLRAWTWLVVSSMALRSQPLPQLVAKLDQPPQRRARGISPQRLGRIVARVLRIGPWRARCLLTSLVLFRLLREQGTDAEVVIGLPQHPKDKRAHAWVEVVGVDVGPPPGRGDNDALVRYSGSQ